MKNRNFKSGRVWSLPMLVAVLALANVAPVFAGGRLPEGKKTIRLVSNAGEALTIGHVTFKKDGDAAVFDLKLDAPEFRAEFLSMRPFPCIAGVKEMWCHLAYPYTLKRRIAADDLTDLEYSLLFLFKPPAGYGIDTWNGLYFKLALGADGAISGPVNDVNLEPLGVPPEDKSARIISPGDLTLSDADSHRFSKIEIR